MVSEKITFSDIRYFLLALFFLWFCQFLILFIPFRWYIPLFKDHRKKNHINPSPANILIVRKALLRGLNYIPWKGKCLVQALTGKLLLKFFNLPGTIYFGVRKGDNQMKAHSWLISGEHFVSGKHGHRQFTVVQEIS
jgi:hypothetical protein